MSGKPWTTREQERFKALYPDTPMPVLIELFGRADTALQTRAKVLGVRRSAAFLASEHGGRLRPGDERSRATRFGGSRRA